jgi:hypothetical protein
VKDRKIKSILIDEQGWIYSTQNSPITLIQKNGEMALIDWFSFGDVEVNGKYVVEIVYERLEAEK